jgi:hypothetical protein
LYKYHIQIVTAYEVQKHPDSRIRGYAFDIYARYLRTIHDAGLLAR